MNVETILWPTDLSQRSIQAASVVRGLAEKHNARIILLYVGIDLHTYFPAYGKPSDDAARRFQVWEMEEARKRLKAMCDNELQGCPLMETRITTGDPAEEILRTARDEKANLIVMSPRGRGSETSDRRYLGTVSSRVLSHSPVNVLTVQDG